MAQTALFLQGTNFNIALLYIQYYILLHVIRLYIYTYIKNIVYILNAISQYEINMVHLFIYQSPHPRRTCGRKLLHPVAQWVAAQVHDVDSCNSASSTAARKRVSF